MEIQIRTPRNKIPQLLPRGHLSKATHPPKRKIHRKSTHPLRIGHARQIQNNRSGCFVSKLLHVRRKTKNRKLEEKKRKTRMVYNRIASDKPGFLLLPLSPKKSCRTIRHFRFAVIRHGIPILQHPRIHQQLFIFGNNIHIRQNPTIFFE